MEDNNSSDYNGLFLFFSNLITVLTEFLIKRDFLLRFSPPFTLRSEYDLLAVLVSQTCKKNVLEFCPVPRQYIQKRPHSIFRPFT